MSDWKFDVDDVGEDADDPGDVPERDEEFEPEPLEPGSPTVENAFFVALGVATVLFVIARVMMLA